VQGVRFLGTEEAKPCYWMESAFGVGAEAAMKGRGGLRARVLHDGWLTRGAIE
jgi:MOSC domain-containing protein YiiM